MELSRHNILGKLRDSESWFLANLLSGQADLLDPAEGEQLSRGEVPDAPAFAAKGYLVDPAEEARRYRTAYLDFLDRRETDEVQIFFVPHYACNFSCTYCFQDEYDWSRSPLRGEVIEAFFAHIRRAFGGRRKYLTLFGGEPLLPGESHRARIAELLDRAAAEGLETAIVTNGYTLSSYLPLLRGYRIREIQVTLDGLQETHDARRRLKGGGSSFQAIVEGIEATLRAGIPLNLRMVVDKQNLSDLAPLARFAIERGWTADPLFKTQIGRNYELHSCQLDRARLFDRAELHEALYREIGEHPEILEFHRPAFSIAKFLWERGELPSPLFDACTGATTEWAFDHEGRIFACTATVGKSGEELGTFWPETRLDEATIAQWERRDVTSIAPCADCSVRLACGGGCAAVARNREGTVMAPDCRPVQELLEMGIALYQRG